MNKALQGAKVRYQKIEKLAFSLVVTIQRLQPYFQSHHIIVMTEHPIKQMLRKPDLAGRMIAWSMELSEFSLEYIGLRAD